MLVNLRALFGCLVDIVLLRRGPESLPASPGLLAFVIALNVAVAAIVVALIPAVPAFSALEMFVSTLLPLLWYQAAFVLAKKPERFVQTMIAFFGVNTLFQPVVTPMFAALLPYAQTKDPNVAPPAALSLLFLAILVWLMIVWVRIVRAAFEWPYAGAIIFVFAENIAILVVYAMLFGAPPNQP